MKKAILAMTLGLGLISAPALYACDMHKSEDTKVMKESKTTGKMTAKKSGKSVQKTVAKKTQNSKS